jgi:hypothetical protein
MALIPFSANDSHRLTFCVQTKKRDGAVLFIGSAQQCEFLQATFVVPMTIETKKNATQRGNRLLTLTRKTTRKKKGTGNSKHR